MLLSENMLLAQLLVPELTHPSSYKTMLINSNISTIKILISHNIITIFPNIVCMLKRNMKISKKILLHIYQIIFIQKAMLEEKKLSLLIVALSFSRENCLIPFNWIKYVFIILSISAYIFVNIYVLIYISICL